MAGLAWWFDGKLGSTFEPEVAPTAADGTLQEGAAEQPADTASAGPTGSSMPSSDLERTPLPDRTVEASLPGFEGATFTTRLELKLRTAEYFRSPPAADLALELRYGTSEPGGGHATVESSVLLTTLQSDHDGNVTCEMTLPADEEGKPSSAILFVVPTTQGTQDVVHQIGLGKYTRLPLQRDLVMPPGAKVRVRAVGLKNPGLKRRLGFPLTVRRIGSDLPPLTTYFQVETEDGEARSIATFPLQEEGRYQLVAHCEEGAGAVKSVQLDPASPPDEITILIGEYGHLSGQVVARHARPEQDLRVRAIADDVADTSAPPDPYRGVDWEFPPRWAEATVDADDGSFHITGLAPGSYRLAYLGSYVNSDLAGWFATDPVSTGTQDLDLDLNETLLVLDLQQDFDEGGIIHKTSTPEVLLEKLPTAADAYAYQVRSRQSEGLPHGYPLVPGNRYRLLVWSPGHPVVEKEFEAPASGGIWRMEIPLPSEPPGTLAWTGPSEEIRYRILSPEYGAEIKEWWRNWGKPDPMEFTLPPGRYLVRAEGTNETDLHHGEVGASRTPFCPQELWAEVRSGETTTLEFDPPRGGWLEIELDAIGQPDPPAHATLDFPALHAWDIQGVYFHQGQANFVMHDLERGGARALTFQHYGGGSFFYEDTLLDPGLTMRPLEVFPPGKYELEVRVPGFPMQKREVLIEAERFTEVKIVLQGVE